MTTKAETARRPGGRSARNHQAVHVAVESLITEGGLAAVTIPAVAERSGVHHTTVYRRWGSAQELLSDAILKAAAKSIPTADTGSFRSDLLFFARHAAESLSSPLGSAMVQAQLSLPLDDSGASRGAYWARRHQVIQPMFDRAIERGEMTSTPADVLEDLLAPLYFRQFVTARPIDDQFIEDLVSNVVERASR